MNGPYGIFLTYLYLFIIGSFLGWILEVFYRRFFSMKRWINPGFLKGPCIPLYGFGLMALHFISYSCFKYLTLEGSYPIIYGLSYHGKIDTVGNLDFYWVSLIAILLIGVAMTLIELIGGLIFVKGLNIRLWDYSRLKGNFMGLICPQFSVIWLICGAIYWFGLRPFVIYSIDFLNIHARGLTFFIGAFVGIFVIDFINSMILSLKLSKTAKLNKLIINYEKFKLQVKDKPYKEKKESAIKVALDDSLEPLKNKIDEIKDKVVKSMYIDGVVPEKNMSETPRMKEERLNEESNKEEK